MIKKRMSAPYREVSSRLKKLLSEGRVIEGSLYRSDRGNTPRHQLSDRATGKYRNIYVPADFAEDVAEWSANWAEAKRLLKRMSEIARAEHFFDPSEFEKNLLANLTGPESCNSVNLLRQTEAIFQCSPEARRMDFYERCLFNHLLSNHDPERGMVVYNTSMKPGTYRYYSDPFDSMWCCTGTGLESPGKLGKMIYTRSADDQVVMVNLFAPSTLDWKSRGVKFRQETRFPYEQGTTLVVEAAPTETEFTLKVRHPAWVADAAFAVAVNGAKVSGESKAGSYFAITRKWKCGDRVQVALPMTLKFEMLPHSKNYGAFVYGPIVLAGELGRQGLPKIKFWRVARNAELPEAASEPVPFATAGSPEEILKMVQPVEGAPLHFRTVGFEPKDVKLSPFFEIHFQRYSIYWKLTTPANR